MELKLSVAMTDFIQIGPIVSLLFNAKETHDQIFLPYNINVLFV